MAVYREPEKCPKCGEEYNGIYSDNEGFVGDTFIMWDVSGHKCNQQPPAASEVQQVGNQNKPKDQDDFYKFLLMEIIDYEHLRSGWKEDSKEYAAYDLVVRQLQKVKSKYVEPTK